MGYRVELYRRNGGFVYSYKVGEIKYEEKKAAKLLANEQRIAAKLARTAQPEPTPAPVVEQAVEEVVEEKPKPKAKAKPKVTVKKKGRPAKAKK